MLSPEGSCLANSKTAVAKKYHEKLERATFVSDCERLSKPASQLAQIEDWSP